MIAFDYLSKGLNGLARAHQMSSMAGHLGAALVAGYFVGEQRPDLELEVYEGLEDDLKRIMAGESVFGKRMSKKAPLTDSELFEDFPKQKPDEGRIDDIADALLESLNEPRESGHNVIFASIAIRALKEHPEYATASIIDGICKLMALFKNAHPGSGYYGKERGRVRGNQIQLPDNDGAPVYTDIPGMTKAVLQEFIDQDAQNHRQGYGGLVHVNNHAAAIVELANQGYGELVPLAIASHHHHFRLWRDLPNLVQELGPMTVSSYTPHQADYWTSGNVPYDRALLTHRVKTMYGFDELTGAIDEDPLEKQAYENLRFLM